MPTTHAPPTVDHQQIALLRFNGMPFLPSVLHRTSGWNHDTGYLYDGFRLVTELDSRVRPLNTYRQFKADLLLADSDLGREDRHRWHMLDQRSSEGRSAEVHRVVSGRQQIFNPVHAAEVYLYRVASSSIRRAREIFPDAASLKVHFTVPAYDNEEKDRRHAKATSERYRDHLRAAVRAFADCPEFSDVEFRLASRKRSKQWLYEPYGVYYYYAALEERIPVRKAGATYLILDMGGSTTDLAVVQVNKRGTEFQQYPTCTSIEIGGTHFDRFLLERLTGRAFRGSASDLEEALAQVENAKIKIADGAEQAQVSMPKRRYTLTRAALEVALTDFWTKGSGGKSLQKEIQAFIRTVQANTKQHRWINTFDAFSGIFLAGGSAQLPRLQTLIEQELTALGVLGESCTAFAMPDEGVHPSSVTALGLAAEVARFDPLERATEVFTHISDDIGTTYTFSLRGLGEPLDIAETLVYSRALLHSRAVTTDGWVNVRHTPDGKEEYSRVRVSGNRVPRYLRIRLRNDLEEEYQHDDIVPVTHFSPVAPNSPLWASFSNHFKLLPDAEGVRIKPILLMHEGSGADAKTIRLRRADKNSPHTRPNYDVSLKPGAVDGDVHICIDFGMSNTSVALMAPGRTFPKVDDLQVFTISAGPAARPSVALPGVVIVRPPETPEVVAPPVKSVAPGTEPAPTGTANLPAPAPGAVEALVAAEIARLERWIEEELGAASRSGTPSPEAIVGAIRSETDALERVLARTVDELKTELVMALAEVGSRSAAPPVPVAAKVTHPSDRLMEEWLAGSPLQEPCTEADLTAKLGGGGDVPASLEERFVRFLAMQYPDVHYEPHVIRAVLAECESDGSRLVVLAGPPGTGKSQLVRLLAEFYNQTLSTEALDRLYLLQPVSPSWYSPASLQGGYSEVEGRFRETPFLTHLLRAELHYDECARANTAPRLSFVCLDEFNLAQPEQYLADILSRMEAPVQSPQRILTLCRCNDAPGLERDITARLTPNLKIFATINVDSSTHFLSPKVLDRSHFVRLCPTVEGLQKVAGSLAARHKVTWFHGPFVKLLKELHGLAEEARTPLGYRALEQVYRFAEFCPPNDVAAVLDQALCSFVLSRLPGVFAVNTPDYRKRLEAMERTCRDAHYPSASRILRRIGEGLPGQAA